MKTAPPCDVPEEQYGKEGFRSAFEGRGGVRGRIVNTGVISRGTVVSFVPPQVV